ncbi:hypothetical protein ABT344_22590 [Micromonospora carbonacea]|uniref:hypothetical protein n=1 Tax=Micromonospora carbonacea TaxID=47853 RepID=UPI00332630AA
MATFAEYAALARQLADQRRETDRDAVAADRHRSALRATLDQLTRRLDAQSHRLDQLGRAAGVTADPPAAPGARPASPTVSPAGTGAGASGAGASGGRAGGSPEPGTAGADGAADAPGRPGVGAYPRGGTTGAVVAVPAAAGVPAPRAGGVDPGAELAEARRLADEADRLIGVTETVGRRPPLLPAWSPLARALAVYAACAAAGVVLAMVLLGVAGVVASPGAVYVATCGALPVLCFVAGYLVLGRWGRPALGADGPPPRFVPLGFVTCVLLMPLAYCGYLVLFRLLG